MINYDILCYLSVILCYALMLSFVQSNVIDLCSCRQYLCRFSRGHEGMRMLVWILVEGFLRLVCVRTARKSYYHLHLLDEQNRIVLYLVQQQIHV